MVFHWICSRQCGGFGVTPGPSEYNLHPCLRCGAGTLLDNPQTETEPVRLNRNGSYDVPAPQLYDQPPYQPQFNLPMHQSFDQPRNRPYDQSVHQPPYQPTYNPPAQPVPPQQFNKPVPQLPQQQYKQPALQPSQSTTHSSEIQSARVRRRSRSPHPSEPEDPDRAAPSPIPVSRGRTQLTAHALEVDALDTKLHSLKHDFDAATKGYQERIEANLSTHEQKVKSMEAEIESTKKVNVQNMLKAKDVFTQEQLDSHQRVVTDLKSEIAASRDRLHETREQLHDARDQLHSHKMLSEQIKERSNATKVMNAELEQQIEHSKDKLAEESKKSTELQEEVVRLRQELNERSVILPDGQPIVPGDTQLDQTKKRSANDTNNEPNAKRTRSHLTETASTSDHGTKHIVDLTAGDDSDVIDDSVFQGTLPHLNDNIDPVAPEEHDTATEEAVTPRQKVDVTWSMLLPAWDITPDEVEMIHDWLFARFRRGKPLADIHRVFDQNILKAATAETFPPRCLGAQVANHASHQPDVQPTSTNCGYCTKFNRVCCWLKFAPGVDASSGPSTVRLGTNNVRWILHKRKSAPTDPDEEPFDIGGIAV